MSGEPAPAPPANEPDTAACGTIFLVLLFFSFFVVVLAAVVAIVMFSDASGMLVQKADYDGKVVDALNDAIRSSVSSNGPAVSRDAEYPVYYLAPYDSTFTLFNLTLTWRECGMLHTVVSLGTQKYVPPSASMSDRTLFVGFSPNHAQLASMLLYTCRARFAKPENWDYYPAVFPQPVLVESTTALTRYSFLPDGLRAIE